jgi:2-iminobutanoate/2-iminopropanoate deaminase
MAAKKTTVKKTAVKKSATKKSAVKKSAVKKTAAKKKPAQKASGAPAPGGPYTPVVRAGDWVIVSGQLGLKDGVLAKGVSAQTAQAVANLKIRLAEAGVTIKDVKKTLCFLTDMDTFATFNEAYVAGFGTSRPARSTIGVAALPQGASVEIEAWAFKPVR